jgi:MFS family permease
MSKLLLLLGAISILTPFSLDLYLPALPAIATDLHATAAAVQLTLPVFFIGLAISQLFFGSVADPVGRRPPLLWASSGYATGGGWGGFWGLAVPQFFFISTLGFNFANGFALALAPFGASAGTASALFGTLQFAMAGLAGAAVSLFYDGSPRAMAGVMLGVVLAGVGLYRFVK